VSEQPSATSPVEPEPADASVATASEPPTSNEPGDEPIAGVDAALRRAVLGANIKVAVLSVFLALVIGAVLLVVTNPTVLSDLKAVFVDIVHLKPFFGDLVTALKEIWNVIWSSYSALFTGSIVDPGAYSTSGWRGVFYPLSETLTIATPLALAGLAVALPFRAGLFNIGAQGQIIMGAIIAGGIGFKLNWPFPWLLITAVLGAVVGGALWAGLAGWLKARTGAHEVITTIMLNYIALYFLQWLLQTKFYQRPGRSDPISPPVHNSAMYPQFFGGNLRVHWGLFVAIGAAIFVWWLFKYSTFGFKLRTVGANSAAARTAGINVGRVWLGAMLLGGVMAGLAASTTLLGTEQALTGGIAGTLGFDAITVALLGRATPLGTVLAALLFGALQAGGVNMQSQTGASVDIVLVLQALIVLFIAAPPLVRAMFRLKGPGAETMQVSKGWNG